LQAQRVGQWIQRSGSPGWYWRTPLVLTVCSKGSGRARRPSRTARRERHRSPAAARPARAIRTVEPGKSTVTRKKPNGSPVCNCVGPKRTGRAGYRPGWSSRNSANLRQSRSLDRRNIRQSGLVIISTHSAGARPLLIRVKRSSSISRRAPSRSASRAPTGWNGKRMRPEEGHQPTATQTDNQSDPHFIRKSTCKMMRQAPRLSKTRRAVVIWGQQFTLHNSSANLGYL